MVAPAPEVGVAEPAPSGAAGTSGDDARSAAVPAPAPGALPDPIGRDVVRTAQLALQVPDPTAGARSVRTAVATAGGVVAEEQVDGTGAWLVVRVPAAGLDRLIDDLAATGVVLGRSGRAEDATERSAPAPTPMTPAPGFGAGLGAGWAGLTVIGSGLATAAGFLLPFLPLLAIAGAVVWVVRHWRARVRRGGPGPEGGV